MLKKFVPVREVITIINDSKLQHTEVNACTTFVTMVSKHKTTKQTGTTNASEKKCRENTCENVREVRGWGE